MSVFAHSLIPYIVSPALALAIGRTAWNVSRAKLLQWAGDTALDVGDRNPRGRAGLVIVKALTSENEPWYRALLPPWRKPDDSSP